MSRTAPQSFPATLVTHAIPQSSLHSFIRHRTQSIRTPHTSPFLICQDPLRNPSPPRSSPMLSPNPPAIHSSGIALNRSARRTQSPSSYVKTRSAILPRHARHPCYPRILPPFIHQASHSIDPHAAAALFFWDPPSKRNERTKVLHTNVARWTLHRPACTSCWPCKTMLTWMRRK